jgi:hypothetical protein
MSHRSVNREDVCAKAAVCSPRPSIFFCVMTLNPWYLTKLVVFVRSSAVSQSLVFRAVGSGQKCCRLDMLGQVCSLSPHSQRAVGWSPIFLWCWWSLQCPVRSRYIVIRANLFFLLVAFILIQEN